MDMTSEQRKLTSDLRAAIEKKTDPVERKLLLDKLALVELHFEEVRRLQRETAEGEALLRKGKLAIFWARVAIGALLIGILGMVAWLLVDALRRH
jgi:hypothetical protein